MTFQLRAALACGTFLLIILIAPRPCLGQDQPITGQSGEVTLEPTSKAPIDVDQEISWQRLVPRLLRDQGKIWLFPLDVARGHHVEPTLAVAGVTASLIALDPRLARPFRETDAFSGFNRAFSGWNTYIGPLAVLPAFYVAGLIAHNSYAKDTALLALEAYLDANVVSLVMEDATRRLLPSQVLATGDLSDTWFRSWEGQSYLKGAGGFPSGHTISAFAIAAVIADRYPHPSWHRWAAYGLAGAVGFSRLSLQSHFASDVFLGAALGIAIPRYVVPRVSRP